MRRSFILFAAFLVVSQPLHAQRGGGGRGAGGRGGGQGVQPAQNSWPLTADSTLPGGQAASYIRRTPPTNPVIQRMWAEGMQRSQVMKLAQVFLDSLGPRLTGSDDSERAQAWTVKTYTDWGISAKVENYGTWTGWKNGTAQVDLLFPRARSLETYLMGWSPGTTGPREGEVVVIPASVNSPETLAAWLPSTRGKFVLASAPRLSCRMPRQWEEFGTPASRARNDSLQDAVGQMYGPRMQAAGGVNGLSERLSAAGAHGLLTFQWSNYPGMNKVFGSQRVMVPNVGLSCEDYGLLFRLAENNQHPRVRMNIGSERLPERPVGNVIAEIRGTQLPNEYVMLSAHFDSWAGGSGATDNATGTMVMMEAMRILKAVYPNPRRTIRVGHWNGEEQGLNGSRAYVEDHPEVIAGLQALWNQDNGTGRVINLSPGPFSNVRPVMERYLSELPSEISQWIRLGQASGSGPATGGTDHAGFQCVKSPGFSLGALNWDYTNTTHHTNRDTYDKIVPDDLMNNATLVAMLVYLASEDPQKMPRDLAPLSPGRGGGPGVWPECAKAARSTGASNR